MNNSQFKVKFNSSSNVFEGVKFQKANKVLKETKMETSSKPVEDIYYDEVIYYDGGGVDGYGNS